MNIRREQWSAEAERGLAGTFGHDRELIIAGVLEGKLELWRIDDGASWMVTRIEAGELIVCCYAGEGLRMIAPRVFDAARRQHLTAIRFYCAKPALARLLREHGFKPEETVYRAEVPHGIQ